MNDRDPDTENIAAALVLAAVVLANAEADWIAEAAMRCQCCPLCSMTGSPCEGCMAGGICDAWRCTCDDEDDDLYEDECGWDDGWDDDEFDDAPEGVCGSR